MLGSSPGGKLSTAGVEGPDEDVVDVTLAGAGAAEGVRVPHVRRAPATGADETAGRSRHGTVTPLRELNSLIISSHTGRFFLSSDQNDCLAPSDKVVERKALLLHPGEVAEVEYPFTVLFGRLDKMIGARRQHPAPESLPGGNGVEATREVPGLDLGPFALVHLGPVGGDRGHDVVGTEIQVLGRLHGGDDVADARQAERAQGAQDRRGDVAPAPPGRPARPGTRRARRDGRWPGH